MEPFNVFDIATVQARQRAEDPDRPEVLDEMTEMLDDFLPCSIRIVVASHTLAAWRPSARVYVNDAAGLTDETLARLVVAPALRHSG